MSKREAKIGIPDWVNVLLIAFLIGLIHLFAVPHPVPAGDAQDYLNAALALIPGTGHVLDDMARTQIIRAPWYVLTLAALGQIGYPLWGQDGVIGGAWLFQIALFAINAGLLYRVAQMINIPSWASRLAAVCMLLYAPFVWMTTRLMVETEVIFCLLLFTWFWLRARPIAAGISLFFALSNSWLSFWPKAILIILLFAGAMIIRRDPIFRDQTIRILSVLLLGGLTLQMVQSVVPHQPMSPTAVWYYADTLGYSTVVAANGMMSLITDQGPQVLVRFMQGQALDVAALFGWLSQHFVTFLLLVGNNLFRLFAMPDNVYAQSWLGIVPEGLIVLHCLLVLSALLSTPYLFHDRRLRILALIPAVWLIYAFAHIEARYNLPMMPFLILLAIAGWSRRWDDLKNKKTFWIELACLLLLTAMSHGVPLVLVERFIGFNQCCSLRTFNILWTMLSLGLFGMLFCRISWHVPFQQQWLQLSGVALGVLPVLCHVLIEPPRSELRTELKQPQQVITQVIAPTVDFWESAQLATFLMLDVQPPISGKHQNDVIVTVNGRRIPSNYPPPPGLSEQKYLLGGLRTPESIRQYRMLLLPEDLVASIQKSGQAVVQIRRAETAQGQVGIYGDLPVNQAAYFIPDPDWGMFSIYKAQYDGDGRLPLKVHANASTHYRIFLYRLLPQDASNPMLPFPNFRQDPATGKLFKVSRLAY